MTNTPWGPEAKSDGHWFAGKDLDVLIYRVNRRPLGMPSLFQTGKEDVLTHMSRVLRGLAPVKTGRRFQREWRVGNLDANFQEGTMTGILGWSRSGEALSNIWDEETQSWTDHWVPSDISGVAPFAFTVGPYIRPLGETDHDVEVETGRPSQARYLGVLRHPSFEEDTVAHVLTAMLNMGEQRRHGATTEWAVEPVGDRDEFFRWLETTDTVTELQFVFKRPNPDGEPEFEELFRRLDRLEASKIREHVTARDPDVGLNKSGLRNDPVSLAFIAAAMSAFGFLVGHGKRQGKKVHYDQRRKALRQRLEDVSPEWEAATEDVLGAVHAATERRRRSG